MNELTQQQLDEILLPEYLTPEQRAAIVSDQGSLLLSASAGSGKTFVLATRVVYQLSHREKNIWADQLLVVTFTRAAAKEMRKRISDQLNGLVAKFPEDEKLQRQKLLLQRAKITTIDAVCSDFVKDHFEELGLSPDFYIGDEIALKQQEDQVLSDLFEEQYAVQDQEFLRLSAYFHPKNDQKLHQAIIEIYHYMRTYPFPLQWLQNNLQNYERESCLADSPWGKKILEYADQTIEYCISLFQDGYQALQQSPVTYQFMEGYCQQTIFALQALNQQLQQSDWDTCCSLISRFKFPAKSRKKKPEGFEANLVSNQDKFYWEVARKQLKELKDAYFCCTEAEFQQDCKEQLPYLQKLFGMVEEFYHRMNQSKLERNMLDFTDLGLYTISLLFEKKDGSYQRTEVGDRIAAQFREILVDEVQDINPLQDMLFQALSFHGDNLFMVGDVKQSIYRFRLADPSIFIRRKQEYYPYGQGKFPATILLAENFRSRKEVTNTVNYLFEQWMTPGIGGLDYTQEPLRASAMYPENPQSCAELHFVDLSKLEKTERIEEEAEYIAGLIHRMYRDGYQVKGEDGTLRPCKLSDFAILLRNSKGNASVFANKLAEYQLDCRTENSQGYLQTREISLLLNLLRVIDNPLQDVPLLSILLSPVFGFTPDDLAEIRAVDKKIPLYRCVVLLAEQKQKCKEFLDQLSELRQAASLLSVEKLIQKIYDETLFYSLFGAEDSSEQRLANLRLMLYYASHYHNSHGQGLSGFLRYMDTAEQSQKELKSANMLTEESSAVQIMSIHKSKGLEFPICILANCVGKFNFQDMKQSFYIDHDLGFTMKHAEPELLKQYETIPFLASCLSGKQAVLSEELRILYVAMTRAKEKLILTVTSKYLNSLVSKAVAQAGRSSTIPVPSMLQANSFADWICMGFVRHPSLDGLRNFAGQHCEVLECSDNSKSQIKFVVAHPISQKEQQEEAEKEWEELHPDPQILEQIKQQLSWQYSDAALTQIPAKLSVTQIVKSQGENRKLKLRRPDFVAKKGLTPAEKGTATHLFVQFADFERAKQDLSQEINRMVEQGFLTQLQADNLDITGLNRLFHSELCKRMEQAIFCYRELDFFYEIDSTEVFSDSGVAGENILIQGIADCVIEESDGLVLVDYKTDHATKQQIKERYTPQLELYRRAIQEKLGKPIKECILYAISLGEEIKL
ncbi:helicase-exonuclease AddAB subunit AddA [Clostridium facile]|uniref:DNA 3'-5' helicase n=1 Tax=Clostridium facile TaxID=2763035 RepID=A0ABR7IRL6_9CLOT|nr:helicase-exonuclease AddAB subunit AddA [Clostridium facile]MBC5787753.1 helicase-exonuclease AddAB subunit AddA [Clostridium facile]